MKRSSRDSSYACTATVALSSGTVGEGMGKGRLPGLLLAFRC